MKALILAGGRGSRLGSETATRNKSMCRYDGHPIIEYSLRNAVEAGCEEIVLLVGYRAETIINEIGIRYGEIPIRYVLQWERRGVVDAIECCRETLAGSDFLLLMADEVLKGPRHQRMAAQFESRPEVFALCGTVLTDDISLVSKTYGVMIEEATRRVHRLIEKPRRPMNNIRGTGNCLFRNEIFEYIARTPINQERGEKELPDLIQCAVDDGKIVQIYDLADWYSNVNTLEELYGPFSELAGREAELAR